MEKEKKYTGYGYHGGGRKPTGIKRASIAISGQPEELEQLKANAKKAGKTVSAFILDALVRNSPIESLKDFKELTPEESEALEAEINLAPLEEI